MMNAATAALAAKAAKLAASELLKLPAPPHGEWRGAYIAKLTSGGVWWWVEQSAADPMRLFANDLGLEYSWGGRLLSDGGSIPKACQGIKELRLKPDSFLKSYFLHDACYSRAWTCVREPGKKWHSVRIDRRQADALLYCGLCAEGATLAEAQTIYRAVRMFGHRAWAQHRQTTQPPNAKTTQQEKQP